MSGARLADVTTIGVDIGGTKVAAGVVGVDGRLLARTLRETPDRSTSASAVEDVIVEAVRELLERHRARAVGVGAAGFVDAARATVRFSPHLSWRDEPLRAALMGRLALPVLVDNDANMAAFGEYRFGAGQGHSQLLCINLGTGIGGGVVLDGKVYRGANGMAGEFGHLPLVPDGRPCECGNRGCWEQYASGTALVRAARGLAAAGWAVAAPSVGVPGAVTGAVVSAAARAGDAVALGLFAEVGRWLGVGLAGLVAAFDPEVVVIGGGVSAAADLLLPAARETLAETVTGRGYRELPPVLPAALGPDAGMIGAAAVARSALHRSMRSPRRRARRHRLRRTRD